MGFLRHTTAILLLSVFCLTLPCMGGSEPIRHVTPIEGLGGESVFKIFKDSRGLVWLGTNKGLSCYNGRSITNFSTGGKSRRNIVYAIAEAPDGTILAGTQYGLYAIDRKGAECRRIHDEISGVNAICILGDKILVGGAEGLWIVSSDKTAEFVPFEKSVISKGNTVNDMTPDGGGAVWLTTNDRIIHFRLKDRHTYKFDVPKDLLTGNLGRLCLIGKNLFIGTHNSGLLKYDIRLKRIGRYVDVDTKVIADLNTDGKSNLYVATDGSGAYLIDTSGDSVKEVYNTRNGKLPSDAVYTYWRDRQLDIDWFGFYLEGFAHDFHAEPLFNIYRYKDFDSSKLPIRSFCLHGRQKAIGTRNGLYLIDESKGLVKHFGAEQLGGNIVTCIRFFSGRYVIANYERGLSVLDPETLELRKLTSSPVLESGNFSRLCPTPDGSRLFATSNMGVVVLDERLDIVKHFDSRNSELPDTYLNDILFDNSGKAWISSLSRMSVYDPLTQTIQSSGFPKNFFNEEAQLRFAKSDDNDIIAFSETSVFRSKQDFSSFEEIDLYDRFDLGSISFIFYDEGHYWVGTNMGLFRFDKHFESYRHFSETDGLPNLSFNAQEIQRTDDGTLWLGNRNALLYISKAQRTSIGKHDRRDIVLDKVTVNGKDRHDIAMACAMGDRTMTLSWNFGSEPLDLYPLQLDFAKDCGRYYEWSVDGDSYSPCSDGKPVRIKGLFLGVHTVSIRPAGDDENSTAFTIIVIPSVLFYAEAAIFLTLLILTFRFVKAEKKRKILRAKIRDKHRIELGIASSEAVERHKKEEEARLRMEEELRMQEMYKRVRMSEYECAALLKQVKQYMADNKAYRNPALRVGDIAESIGTTPNKLSQMFSQHMHTTFAEFINAYRIEEFKRKVEDPKYGHLTTVALAETCGLRKSSFFSAFKKAERCTPSEYMAKKGLDKQGKDNAKR